MTFAYTNDPADVPVDRVRFLLGDTIAADALLSNEEIQWALDEVDGDAYAATVDLCQGLAARFTRMATSKSVGELSLSYQDRAAGFLALGDRIRTQGLRRTVSGPWKSPSVADPEFSVGMHDNLVT